MTVDLPRSSQRIRSNSTRAKDKLEGFVPFVEDRYAKVSFLGVWTNNVYINNLFHVFQVIWKQLYKCYSGMDSGTLYQLQKLINWWNAVKDPSNNVAPCEEFLMLVVEAHIGSCHEYVCNFINGRCTKRRYVST